MKMKMKANTPHQSQPSNTHQEPLAIHLQSVHWKSRTGVPMVGIQANIREEGGMTRRQSLT
jgi:hypothetical protein